MRKSDLLVTRVCAPCCAWYKPGTNEDLLCQGAVVVERLMRSRLPPVLQPASNVPPAVSKALIEKVCAACAFREDGCDFAAGCPAPPCGGFVYLRGLLSADIIGINDIG